MKFSKPELAVLRDSRKLSTEKLGLYILRCLKELNGERKTNIAISKNRQFYNELINEFCRRGKVKESRTGKTWRNSAFSSMLTTILKRRTLAFESEEEKRHRVSSTRRSAVPTISYAVTSKRATRIDKATRCTPCRRLVRPVWRYHTETGDIYLCDFCKRLGVGMKSAKKTVKKADMWGKMIFTAFETNRRKH